MPRRTRNSLRPTAPHAACAFACAAAGIAAGFTHGQIGLQDLADRIGSENVPTGAGIVVSQVEVANANGNYRPNIGHAEFDGKTFTLLSGPSNTLPHATQVGFRFYGLDTSVAPGIDSIYCYHAVGLDGSNNLLGWLGADFLRTGSTGNVHPLPLPAPIRVFNHSWIGQIDPFTDEAMRRADFVVRRDHVMMICGVANVEPAYPILSASYNGISVGRSSGGHIFTDTPADFDGPGRMKPEIVAPQILTSYATGMVSAAAALMVETATSPPLDQNPLAQRSEVIKAALLGGAERGPQWTNNPAETGPTRGLTARPLDEVVGSGEVNLNKAHLILTGNQWTGKTSPPTGAHLCQSGWDLISVAPGQSRYWRFSLPQSSDTVSVLATWHRVISPANVNVWSIANFDLRLWRVDAGGNLATLVGPLGEPYFSAGNVASESPVDNVELLHVHDLAPGDYVIEVERVGTSGTVVDVALAWRMDSAVRHADITGDGIVDIFDLLAVLAAWGPCPDGVPGCDGDLNCDGVVDIFDLLRVLSQWG